MKDVPEDKISLVKPFKGQPVDPKVKYLNSTSICLFKERPLITSNQALDVNLEELYVSFMKALELEVDFIVIFSLFLLWVGYPGKFCERNIMIFTIREDTFQRGGSQKENRKSFPGG